MATVGNDLFVSRCTIEILGNFRGTAIAKRQLINNYTSNIRNKKRIQTMYVSFAPL